MKDLIRIRDLSVRFYTYEGVVHAIDDLDLDIRQKETLGIVGETGSGKSMTALANLTSLISLDLGDNQISSITPLAGIVSLTHLYVEANQVSDISPLAGLTNLVELYIEGNQISDISPLVENQGISQGDEVALWGNPLSSDSINIYIPELQARGVTVYY